MFEKMCLRKKLLQKQIIMCDIIVCFLLDVKQIWKSISIKFGKHPVILYLILNKPIAL